MVHHLQSVQTRSIVFVLQLFRRSRDMQCVDLVSECRSHRQRWAAPGTPCASTRPPSEIASRGQSSTPANSAPRGSRCHTRSRDNWCRRCCSRLESETHWNWKCRRPPCLVTPRGSWRCRLGDIWSGERHVTCLFDVLHGRSIASTDDAWVTTIFCCLIYELQSTKKGELHKTQVITLICLFDSLCNLK